MTSIDAKSIENVPTESWREDMLVGQELQKCGNPQREEQVKSCLKSLKAFWRHW